VPGTLTPNADKSLLVDIGTGFLVQKNRGEAKEFYEGKVKELEGSLNELEGIVKGKAEGVRVVEEVLREKILAGNQTPEESEGKSGKS